MGAKPEDLVEENVKLKIFVIMLSTATKPYIKFENGGYWVTDTRISLDSIVYAFWQGLSPESIVQSYPLLTLEKVYGALTFYLANRADIDAYLATEEQAFDAMPQPLKINDRPLYDKLIAAKTALGKA